MSPLIALAVTLLPDLIHHLIGDRAGAVADGIAQAVQAVTGTADPAAARQKIESDAAAANALRIRLAEIALESEKARSAAEQAARAQELARLQARLADVASARTAMTSLAAAGSSIAWGPPVVSVIVTAGFFAIIGMLIALNQRIEEGTAALVNITVGALGAAFTAVVNFWIGSSQGSRDKDATVRSLASEQMAHAAAAAPSFAAALGAAVRGAQPAAPLAELPPDRFDRCVEVVLGQEGGFADHPADPGGATCYGITRQVLSEWRGREATAADVSALDQAEAREIYRARYWNAMRCGELPAGVDLMVFDFGVNAGPGTAVRLLQRLAGAEPDGAVGPKTLAAARGQPAPALIARYAEGREAYYRALPGFPSFGKGWLARVEFVRRAALRIAA
ncbi:MAG TPA: glycosyl hydrolase 108 family protein [Crenalkalicoccus sp.]|nr:glycosyl hydrolase 108 family protein [Crenalkalicoccus sp.]